MRSTRTGVTLATAVLTLHAASAAGQTVPLLRDDTARALAAELSGETAKRNLDEITRHHRIRGSRQFRRAADFVVEQLRNVSSSA